MDRGVEERECRSANAFYHLREYRMGMLNALCTNLTDRNMYFKAVRKRFKSFCYLPKCMPNTTVGMLLGSVEDMAGEIAVRTIEHLAEDGADL